MKKFTPFVILIVFIGAVCLYQLLPMEPVSAIYKEQSSASDSLALPKENFRPSIAFILGDDKKEKNYYYKEALRYYTTHPKGKTDFVVTTCRSLKEVKSYLLEYAEVNAQPWGDVHLITHGNQWTGLSVKVTPETKRATAQRIQESTLKDGFEFLPSSTVDNLTRIFLQSCGVGNDELLVDAVKDYLDNQESSPTVYAPKLFEYYTSDASGKNSQKYLAETWIISYPLEERPEDLILMNELREKNKDASIDWYGALKRDKPRWNGDAYHYTFDVPVKLVVPVDSVINLTTDKLQMEWLSQQHEIVKELDRLQLSMKNFKWTFTPGYAEDKDGGRTNAISVKGYCTVLCVVKALTQGEAKSISISEPFIPALTDNRFYYKSSSKLLARR